ncbi:hypothetical protein HOY82DRAFT_601736 [Tuber indicum]|nr:hypothetical protein HOY82DRAFT_601736 [Tuber indicum]
MGLPMGAEWEAKVEKILATEEGLGRGHEQSGRSGEFQNEDDNQFWAWMDLNGSGGASVKDDYDRYCSKSEPETSIRNPLQPPKILVEDIRKHAQNPGKEKDDSDMEMECLKHRIEVSS